MLPILSELEFSDIIPLSESSTHIIKFESGINSLLANNGHGKTTLCDIIERALCSDAHAQRYSSFSRKRASKDAYIKSTWFFSQEAIIKQNLTDAGIRTHVSESGKGTRSYSKQEYSNYLFRKLKISLDDLQDLYQSLYFKREDSHTLLGREEENDLYSFFRLIHKYTSGAPEDYQLRQKIREKEQKRKDTMDQVKKLEETEEKIRSAMQLLGIEAVSEQILTERYKELEKQRKQKEEIIEIEEEKIQELEKEEEKLNELLFAKKEENYEMRIEIDKIRTNRNNLARKRETILKSLDVAEKVGSEKYDYLKTKISQKPMCEFCHTNLERNWDRRLQVGCPICGTEWHRLPASLKEGLFNIEKQEMPESQSLEEDLAKTEAELIELNEKLKQTEEEFKQEKQQERQLHETISSIRAKIKQHDQVIKGIMKEINQSVKSITLVETQMDFIKENINLNAIISRKESLKQKLQEIQEELLKLKANEPSTVERTQILKQFSETALDVFGYGMHIDPKFMTLSLLVDGSNRAYESMSGGEKYFIDIALRIAVWKYLINKGYAKYGMLIIDSPENALDGKRLELLATVLNDVKDNFLIIVTTRNREFSERLYSTPIKVKKEVQTSLFDYIHQ